MPRTSDTPQPPQEQRDLFLPGRWARPQVPSSVTCSGWLAASLVLISGSVTAQEALRNSLAGEAAASGRHQQEQPGAYTVKSRSEEHTSELQSRREIVCLLLLENIKILVESVLLPI